MAIDEVTVRNVEVTATELHIDVPQDPTTDPGIARDGERCLRVEYATGFDPLIFKHGVVGPLDEGQQALYCQEYEDRPVSEAQRRRLALLQEVAPTCSTEAQGAALTAEDDHIAVYLSCLSRELAAKEEEP